MAFLWIRVRLVLVSDRYGEGFVYLKCIMAELVMVIMIVGGRFDFLVG